MGRLPYSTDIFGVLDGRKLLRNPEQAMQRVKILKAVYGA